MEERRYYGLDALRGGMMMLGIVLHSAELYLAAPPPQIPFPSDPNTSYVCDLLFHFIHSFRMPTFFVLAGFFSALLVEKRGLWGTYKNRGARVLAPLAAALLTIWPLTVVLVLDFLVAARFGVRELVPNMPLIEQLMGEIASRGRPAAKAVAAANHELRQPAAMHLWFLIYLCYFYLLLPLCAWLARSLSPWAPKLQTALGSPWMIVPLALFTAATLTPYRGAQVMQGFIFFKPHLPSIVYYGSFFVLGYLFRHFPALLETAKRRAREFGLASAVLFALALYCSHLEYAMGPRGGVHIAAVIANGFCTWALIYFFIGAALRWFDYAANWILYASQSSYWVFLIHLPLVLLGGWWLTQYDLPGLAKFVLLTALVSAACFLSYHFLVQRSWMSVFLNGKRFNLPLPWK